MSPRRRGLANSLRPPYVWIMHGDAEYKDHPPSGPLRGRGAGLNPGNRFEDFRLHVLGEHLDEVITENPDGTRLTTRIYHDSTRTIINKVADSPDIPFDWSINPYRGCEHGCIYCYARPGHEYLGLSCGVDFETKIFAKRNAPELLRTELSKPSWRGESIVMSGVTDPYQPVEAKLRLTRRILEVMHEFGQPVGMITKNHLITRDIDLLGEMARHHAASAAISITTLDNKLAAKMEPRASSPRERLAAVRELAKAGVPVAVMTAPIIPGLNDHEIPKLLEAAAEAGATSAGYVLLRLPYQIKDLFLDWLARHFPDRAARVESGIRAARDGNLSSAEFHERQRGNGPLADQIAATFKLFARRHGLDAPHAGKSSEWFVDKRRQRERAAAGPTLFEL
jgi:DNA repair photolyase